MIALWFLLTSAVAAAPSATTMTVSNSQLTVHAGVEPEVAAPGSELTITFLVSPARGIHVYAPGAEYQVIGVRLDAQPGVRPRKIEYPPSEMFHFEPLDETVPVYQKPFTLKQVVAVSASALKGKKTLKLSGSLDYQACNDRVCFRPASIPFAFELKAK